MNRVTRFLIGLAVVIGALGPAIPVRADGLEDRVLELANQERANQGLALLVLADELQGAARGFAGMMARGGFFSHDAPDASNNEDDSKPVLDRGGFFSHDAPDGSTPSGRIEAAGYGGWTFVAENIAAGQRSPEAVMASWMNSEHHRANLLDPRAREIGIGHVFAGGTRYGHYWV